MIDTHILVWYFTGSERLSEEMKERIDRIRGSGGRILVPTIVLSEALYIAENEREVSSDRETVLDFDALYRKIVDDIGFEVVGFGQGVLEEATRVTSVPELHDRIITATARFYGAEIMTDDPEIESSEG